METKSKESSREKTSTSDRIRSSSNVAGNHRKSTSTIDSDHRRDGGNNHHGGRRTPSSSPPPRHHPSSRHRQAPSPEPSHNRSHHRTSGSGAQKEERSWPLEDMPRNGDRDDKKDSGSSRKRKDSRLVTLSASILTTLLSETLLAFEYYCTI